MVNPSRVKYYGQRLGVRSKNDKKNSVVLARYGLTQNPITWQPEAPEIRILKALSSRLGAIEKDILREKNRYEKSSINPCSDLVLSSVTDNSWCRSCCFKVYGHCIRQPNFLVCITVCGLYWFSTYTK